MFTSVMIAILFLILIALFIIMYVRISDIKQDLQKIEKILNKG